MTDPDARCTCLSISRDPLCAFHGDRDKLDALARARPRAAREEQRLETLAADPSLRVKGWDSYGAEPLTDAAVEGVRKFLKYAWAVVPCNDGGIQLERHDSGIDLEIEFDAAGRIEDVYAQLPDGRHLDADCERERAALAAARLAEPDTEALRGELALTHAALSALAQEHEQLKVGYMNLGTLLKTGGMDDPSFIYGQVEALEECNRECGRAVTVLKRERDAAEAALTTLRHEHEELREYADAWKRSAEGTGQLIVQREKELTTLRHAINPSGSITDINALAHLAMAHREDSLAADEDTTTL